MCMNFSIFIICPTILLLLLLAMIQISNNNGMNGKITNSKDVVRLKNVSPLLYRALNEFSSLIAIIIKAHTSIVRCWKVFVYWLNVFINIQYTKRIHIIAHTKKKKNWERIKIIVRRKKKEKYLIWIQNTQFSYKAIVTSPSFLFFSFMPLLV